MIAAESVDHGEGETAKRSAADTPNIVVDGRLREGKWG